MARQFHLGRRGSICQGHAGSTRKFVVFVVFVVLERDTALPKMTKATRFLLDKPIAFGESGYGATRFRRASGLAS
jgi:hypothetical protein